MAAGAGAAGAAAGGCGGGGHGGGVWWVWAGGASCAGVRASRLGSGRAVPLDYSLSSTTAGALPPAGTMTSVSN